MIAMPHNFVRSRLVESETEWRFVPPHLFRHVIPPSQLIGKAVPECVEDETTNSADCLCCEELDFDIWVVWLHQISRVHLDPLEINGLWTVLIALLVQCSPLVVGKSNKSGRNWASNELLVISAPKPPLANMTASSSA